jgi:3,4-dihydroxy 2-butanone 4-phosphate synthase/GTP cyclohydrolase II
MSEHQFSSIEDAVKSIAAGNMAIVVDAEDRENEGDFICAAEKITPQGINFMLKHARGRICTAILPDVADRLDLPLMISRQPDSFRTAFTITVDHKTNKTGITAKERATTIQAIIDPESVPNDFRRPGHVDPLIAKEGGVLRRAGHTEAAIDLTRLAGTHPSGVICEILNETGDRASRSELFELAAKFDMPIITIEDLIRYRRRREQIVERLTEAKLPTAYGEFKIIAYGVKYEQQQPIVLVHGDLTKVHSPLVRLHSSCFTGDLLNSLRCDCGDQLQMAMEMIGKEGAGVLVYLPQEGRGIGLVEKIRAYNLQDDGLDTVEANLALGFKADVRDYGIGIQILKDLGLAQIRLLTNNPKKTDAFIYDGFELTVTDQVPIMPPSNEHNQRYLATKRDKMGHRLSDELL